MLLRVKLWMAAAGLVVAALVASWLGGRKAGKTDAKVDALRDDVKRHGDMNDADIGVGATDEQHVKWLRDFAERNQR